MPKLRRKCDLCDALYEYSDAKELWCYCHPTQLNKQIFFCRKCAQLIAEEWNLRAGPPKPGT